MRQHCNCCYWTMRRVKKKNANQDVGPFKTSGWCRWMMQTNDESLNLCVMNLWWNNLSTSNTAIHPGTSVSPHSFTLMTGCVEGVTMGHEQIQLPVVATKLSFYSSKTCMICCKNTIWGKFFWNSFLGFKWGMYCEHLQSNWRPVPRWTGWLQCVRSHISPSRQLILLFSTPKAQKISVSISSTLLRNTHIFRCLIFRRYLHMLLLRSLQPVMSVTAPEA